VSCCSVTNMWVVPTRDNSDHLEIVIMNSKVEVDFCGVMNCICRKVKDAIV